MTRLFEYIWLDSMGNCRSKIKLSNAESPLVWNYDGSSTGQADGNNSEVLIQPVRCVNHPFYPKNFHGQYNLLVLCETLNPDGTPHCDNTRRPAAEIFDRYKDQIPIYGLKQEFFLQRPGHKRIDDKEPQGRYYCGVGTQMEGREVVEEAMRKCEQTGMKITGMNAEVAPLQWKLQLCESGITAADNLVLLRYILVRVAEKHGYDVIFHPKPYAGDWNGSGCHTNFSTSAMRQDGGLEHIHAAIKKLAARHVEHMANYGHDNDLRFSWGVADRGASIRIPSDVAKHGKGYFEDRRPSANMDPYLVTSMILETINQ